MLFDLRAFDFVLYDGVGDRSRQVGALASGLARMGRRVLALGCGSSGGSRRFGEGVVIVGHVLEDRSGLADTLVICSPSVSPSIVSRRTIVLASPDHFVARLWPLATLLRTDASASEIIGVTEGGTTVGLGPRVSGPRNA